MGRPNRCIGYNKISGNNSVVRNASGRLMPMDVSAKMYSLSVDSSVAVLAEILLRSPWKFFIFTIKICIYRIKVSKNKLI